MMSTRPAAAGKHAQSYRLEYRSVIAGEGRVSGIGDPRVPTAQHEWSGVLPQDGNQLIQADSAHRNGERLDGNVTLP